LRSQLMQLILLIRRQHVKPVLESSNILPRGADKEIGQVRLRLVVVLARAATLSPVHQLPLGATQC